MNHDGLMRLLTSRGYSAQATKGRGQIKIKAPDGSVVTQFDLSVPVETVLEPLASKGIDLGAVA